jgi:hypothetical protein
MLSWLVAWWNDSMRVRDIYRLHLTVDASDIRSLCSDQIPQDRHEAHHGHWLLEELHDVAIR